MPGAETGSKANYRLIGAVVETPVGSYFFKMTGPKKTVESARGSYMTLLDSMKPDRASSRSLNPCRCPHSPL